MAAAAASVRGDGYMADGDKAMNRSTFFGFGRSQKYEDAKESYVKAGNAYKLANQWQSAGEAFMKAAGAIRQTESPTDAASVLIDAAGCFKKINPSQAADAFHQVILMSPGCIEAALSRQFILCHYSRLYCTIYL